jgi:hypothetical protein
VGLVEEGGTLTPNKKELNVGRYISYEEEDTCDAEGGLMTPNKKELNVGWQAHCSPSCVAIVLPVCC